MNCFLLGAIATAVFVIMKLQIKNKIFKSYIEYVVYNNGTNIDSALIGRIFDKVDEDGLLEDINRHTFKRIGDAVLIYLLNEATNYDAESNSQ